MSEKTKAMKKALTMRLKAKKSANKEEADKQNVPIAITKEKSLEEEIDPLQMIMNPLEKKVEKNEILQQIINEKKKEAETASNYLFK